MTDTTHSNAPAARCTYVLASAGKPYPRTCAECGLGPCKRGYNSGSFDDRVKAATPAPVSAGAQKPSVYLGKMDFEALQTSGRRTLTAYSAPVGDSSNEVALYTAQPQADCERCQGSGEDPQGFLSGGGPDAHTVDGPCRDCAGTGAAPALQVGAGDADALIEKLVCAAWVWGESCGVDGVSREKTGDSYNEWLASKTQEAKRSLLNALVNRAAPVAAAVQAPAAGQQEEDAPDEWAQVLSILGKHQRRLNPQATAESYAEFQLIERLRRFVLTQLRAALAATPAPEAESESRRVPIEQDVCHAYEQGVADASAATVKAMIAEVESWAMVPAHLHGAMKRKLQEAIRNIAPAPEAEQAAPAAVRVPKFHIGETERRELDDAWREFERNDDSWQEFPHILLAKFAIERWGAAPQANQADAAREGGETA